MENDSKKILTIDLEDWFHPLEQNTNLWHSFERRVEIPTIQILQLLKEYKSKATFFVLGDVAKNHSNLINKIADEGHEIASHGMNHKFIYKQNSKEFEEDLKTSIELLKSITGKEIKSYRAPYFSITSKSMWALNILKDNGVNFDSSIFPIVNHRYGIPNANREPYEIKKNLWEYPISTLRFANINIPFAGGVYFRFYPLSFINQTIKKFHAENKILIFYLHPWECDPFQPVVKTKSWFLNFRHYYGLKKTLNKLEEILKKYIFTSIEEFHLKRN